MRKFSGIAVALALLFGSTGAADEIGMRVVYGEDNRRDIFEVDNWSHLLSAESAVALISKNQISFDSEWAHIRTGAFTYVNGGAICTDEPFWGQMTAAFCTGFLVSPYHIATAGHCIRNETECDDTYFVFGFSMFSADDSPNAVPASEVYGCRKLIHSQVSGYLDFAVVQLDRPVEYRMPLQLSRRSLPLLGDPLYVIGHPSGLPTKVADGGFVRQVSDYHFVANLDTYGGNSGSPVINDRTHEVEGILIGGEMDFTNRRGCVESNRCDDYSCSGEMVTAASVIAPYIY